MSTLGDNKTARIKALSELITVLRGQNNRMRATIAEQNAIIAEYKRRDAAAFAAAQNPLTICRQDDVSG